MSSNLLIFNPGTKVFQRWSAWDFLDYYKNAMVVGPDRKALSPLLVDSGWYMNEGSGKTASPVRSRLSAFHAASCACVRHRSGRGSAGRGWRRRYAPWRFRTTRRGVTHGVLSNRDVGTDMPVRRREDNEFVFEAVAPHLRWRNKI
jgi:hypothetical protein